jgi:hypothetical protein
VWIACGKGVYMMCDKSSSYWRVCLLDCVNKILTWWENDGLCETYLERLPLWLAQELHTLCFSYRVEWKNQRHVWVSWLCTHPKLLFFFFRQSDKHHRNIHYRYLLVELKFVDFFFVYFYFYCRKNYDALNYSLDYLMCDKYISYTI